MGFATRLTPARCPQPSPPNRDSGNRSGPRRCVRRRLHRRVGGRRWTDPAARAVCDVSAGPAHHPARHRQARRVRRDVERDRPVHPARKARLGTAVAGRGRRLCRRTRRRVARDGRFAGAVSGTRAAAAELRARLHADEQGPRAQPQSARPRWARPVAGGRHRRNHRPVRRVLRPGHRQLPGLPVRARVRPRLPARVRLGQDRQCSRRMPPPSSCSG